MTDPIADIIGDYRAHLAVRVADWDGYGHLRMLLERHATAVLEHHVLFEDFTTGTGPNPPPR